MFFLVHGPEHRYLASIARGVFELGSVATGFGPSLAVLETGAAATEVVSTKKIRAYAENNMGRELDE